MHPVSVTVTVASFDRFLETFRQRGQPLRERHGSRGVRVMRHAEDDARVTLLFDWEPEAFAGFLADPDVRESMRASGTLGPPEVVVLQDVTTLPA